MVGVPERSQSGLATLSMVGISGGEESELCCKVEGGSSEGGRTGRGPESEVKIKMCLIKRMKVQQLIITRGIL